MKNLIKSKYFHVPWYVFSILCVLNNGNFIIGFLAVNLPLQQSVRYRHRRFNFKYIRPPHDRRALVEQVCRPVLPLDVKLNVKPPKEKSCGLDLSTDDFLRLEHEVSMLLVYFVICLDWFTVVF